MHLLLRLFCVLFYHHLQMGIELGTLRTEGCALTDCATLTPPLPPEDEVGIFLLSQGQGYQRSKL